MKKPNYAILPIADHRPKDQHRNSACRLIMIRMTIFLCLSPLIVFLLLDIFGSSAEEKCHRRMDKLSALTILVSFGFIAAAVGAMVHLRKSEKDESTRQLQITIERKAPEKPKRKKQANVYYVGPSCNCKHCQDLVNNNILSGKNAKNDGNLVKLVKCVVNESKSNKTPAPQPKV